MTQAIVKQKKLEDKVYALREVWGSEDIDRVLIWCWRYAEKEMGYLQVTGNKNLIRLARERTTETVDQLVNLTKLARNESAKKLEREIDYSELKDVLANLKIQMRFICTRNYEALIHKRYCGDQREKSKAKLEELFK